MAETKGMRSRAIALALIAATAAGTSSATAGEVVVERIPNVNTGNEAPSAKAARAWNWSESTAREAWEKTTEASSEAWEKTKAVSTDAWEKTKSVSEESWEKTKQVSGKTWEKTRSKTGEVIRGVMGDDAPEGAGGPAVEEKPVGE